MQNHSLTKAGMGYRRARFLSAAALALVACLQVVSAEGAGYCTSNPEGCYRCEYFSVLGNESYCSSVSGTGWGEGSMCRDCNVAGRFCLLGGSECVTVTPDPPGGGGGGGGGGAGGGSTTSCTIRPGTLCPAWCMSCSYYTF